MSNCWKCGRDLPDGQVECEPVCGGVPAGDMLVINFSIVPDRKKLATPGGQMMFNRAMRDFMLAIAHSFSATGLNEFCKSVPPPPEEEGE
jgi:hypothetical protein